MDHTGKFHEANDLINPFDLNFSQKEIVKALQKITLKLKKDQAYQDLSDYGVWLLKAGKTTEALAIFKKLFTHYPTEYALAANLGTAYELANDIPNAIIFIKKGIDLNPNAHEGSEWIHVKILEAKLKLEKDSTYLFDHTILGLTKEQKNDTTVLKQLDVQIRERFPFSPSPNLVMADLLVSLGDCYRQTRSIEWAKVLYTIAKNHYKGDKKIIHQKIREVIKLRNRHSKQHPVSDNNQENIKLVGIPYQQSLQNNQISNYSIKWDEVITDIDVLFSYVKLPELPKPPVKEEKIVSSVTVQEPLETISPKEIVPVSRSYWIYGVVALFVGLTAFLIWRRRKK